MSDNVIASSATTVILGLGVTGLSCARYLHASGQRFAVADTRAQPPGLEALREQMPEVPVFVGDVPPSLLNSAQRLIVSPGIALQEPLVVAAANAGAQIVGDIDLFVAAAQAPVVGITGSNAKSTVTSMVGEMARAAGLDVGVGGNLGTPALDLLAPQRQLYVVELSSFQLERAARLNLAVATVLNVSPDHLDRHGDLVAYHQAKHRIFRGCGAAVVNRADPLTQPLLPADVKVVSWGLSVPEPGHYGVRDIDGEATLCRGFDALLPVSELSLVGGHNVGNALAALALGEAAGLPVNAMLQVLREFRALAHRSEVLAEVGGVRFVNDSKGTNVGATEAALRGLGGERNVVLIAGGQGKGADFSALRPAVERHVKSLQLIGEAAPDLGAALAGVAPVADHTSLESAFAGAVAQAQAGDVVLLSPACASFDMFSGYAQRGDCFRALVVAHEEASDDC
jgi:UDP-N-acetylmuramoylalanine--D-glutamate ligase